MYYSRLAFLISAVMMSRNIMAHDYSFDPSFINGGKDDVNISLFNKGFQLPGTYYVTVLVNGETVTTQAVRFNLTEEDDNKKLQPCLSLPDITRFGIDVSKYPELSEGNGDTGNSAQCVRLNAIPQSVVYFDFNQQKLSLTVPPQAMLPQLSGIAPPQLWNDGVPAIILNYQGNIQRSDYRGAATSGGHSDSRYVQLQPGINIGPWRLRNSVSWQQYGQQQGQWQNLYTYAERGLNGMKSRLTLGESYSSGDVFDSVPFRGVMLATDENMIPYDQREFAPVIRGIARTQARVEVKQNGYTLSSVTVPSGPFELTNLPSTGSSGDLQVMVMENDGSLQTFTVPYTMPAVALRQGYLKYSASGGQYRPSVSSVKKTPFGVAEIMYGLPRNLTAYGGLQAAEHYTSAALGVGAMLNAFGALSLDVTRSQSQKAYQEHELGQRWRLRYNKTLDSGTSVSLAGEEYASSGFSTLTDTLDTWCENNDERYSWCRASGYSYEKQRNRLSMTLGQSMNKWGYINLNALRQTYWRGKTDTLSYGAGYSTVLWNGVSVSLSWTRNRNISRDGRQSNDNLTSMWVSFPLDRWLEGGNHASASWQLTAPSRGNSSQQIGMNGDLLDRQLHWDIRERYNSGQDNDRTSSALNLNYRGTYGEVNGNYSYSSRLRQMGAGISGGMVLTSEDGLVAGQSQGDTLAVVSAPGVSGANVNNWPGMNTDFRGYTNTGYLQPYQKNSISINPASLPDNVDLPQTSIDVVPTSGAVILAKFPTRTGGRLLLTLTRSQGKTIPFGAIANVESSEASTGIVGNDSEVYLTGMPPYGKVKVIWGREQDQGCTANIRLPQTPGAGGVYILNALCSEDKQPE